MVRSVVLAPQPHQATEGEAVAQRRLHRGIGAVVPVRHQQPFAQQQGRLAGPVGRGRVDPGHPPPNRGQATATTMRSTSRF